MACLCTETESNSINTHEKNEAIIQPSCSNKLDKKRIFIILTKNVIFWCGASGNPEGAGQRHLACSGNQSQRGIRFNLSNHGASHIMHLVSGRALGRSVTKEERVCWVEREKSESCCTKTEERAKPKNRRWIVFALAPICTRPECGKSSPHKN